MEFGGSEITHHCWASRAQNSVCGSIVGVLLFFGSFALLGWNEARSVAEIRALNECAAKVVSVDCGANPLGNGRLIHVACGIPDIPNWSDADFGVTVHSAGLKRVVEMLQWEQSSTEHCTKDAVGGGKTCKTDYYYQRSWRSQHISSDGFFNHNYQNPPSWVVDSKSWAPDTLHAGNYTLPRALISQVVDCNSAGCTTGVPPPAASVASLPICANFAAGACPWSLRDVGGTTYFYYSAAFEPGGVGDVRVLFQKSTAEAVSVVAVQQPLGSDITFAPYIAQSGHQCFLLDIGYVTPQDMLQEAQARNRVATWIIRVAGILMMWVGQLLFLAPLSVALDIVPFLGPFLGDLVSFGAGVISLPITLMLSLFTISVAWIAVRPALGVPLFLISIGLAAGIAYLRTLKQRQRIGGSAGMGPSGPAFAYAPYTDETGGAGGGGGFVPGGYGVPAGVTPLAPAPAPGAGGWFRVA